MKTFSDIKNKISQEQGLTKRNRKGLFSDSRKMIPETNTKMEEESTKQL